ncbi:MAG: class I SAM-dependent methyltransferase [Campylobacterota bacterium]|nr:class I SAM-dependent methyltransferase [Campylobacterota bacterium]
MDSVQIDKNHYDFLKYENINRFASYYFQLKTVIELNPKNILEIGKGSGFFYREIKNQGIDIKVADFDESLNPDYVADVKNLPFEDNSFECICAFQILEHLPFDDFKISLKELKRVSLKYIFISLPDKGRYIKIDLRLPKIKTIKKLYDISNFKRDIHIFNGEHYWEINKIGYEEKKIQNLLTDNKWNIILNNRLFENPYHRFYLLEKNTNE